MLKMYDKLWDQNATVAMGALIQREDFTNMWEVARKAYEIANCMSEIRQEEINAQGTQGNGLEEKRVHEHPPLAFSFENDVIDLSGVKNL